MHRRLLGAFFVLITVALGLIVAELGLRAADRYGWIQLWSKLRQARESSIWIAAADPRLIYQHRPNYVKDGTRQTESHGILRPVDVDRKADSGVVRIAALGDSVAAAIDLPYEQRMLTRVERSLSSGGASRQFEVLNFAVNGYSTEQEARLLENLAQDFDPDMLIVQFCMNDFHPTRFPTKWFREYSRSYVLTLARFAFDQRLLDGYPPSEYWEKTFRRDSAGWESVANGFGRISRYARARGIPALVVIFPLLPSSSWEDGDAADRHARVGELARSSGLETLDLLPVFSRYPVEALRRESWDTFHPNAEGHRLAASAIVEALERFETLGWEREVGR